MPDLLPGWTATLVRALAGAVLAGAALAAGCASSGASGPAAGSGGDVAGGGGTPVAAPGPPGATGANLAGKRCHGAICSCRNRHGNPAEDPAPDEGHKRFEIRLGAEDGTAGLDSPTLGHFASGPTESCFYVDLVPGTIHDLSFVAREASAEAGVGPLLAISEYGPKGPWWYDVIEVHCAGPGGRCNRDAADAWGADVKKRRRGRAEPCGSSVISHLVWGTSGGTGSREMGLYKDFSVTFTMEIKKFPTQFAPGSTECVPK